MKIGPLYFDEKDILLILSLVALFLIKYFKLGFISFISIEKLFLILLMTLLARIFWGKGKEKIYFVILIFAVFISGTLSYPALLIFLLFSFLLSTIIFRRY